MNVVFACTSSAVYWYITTMLDYKSMMDENQKNYIDYLVAFVLTLAWSRFFFLFLVVPSISKMILTLFTMLIRSEERRVGKECRIGSLFLTLKTTFDDALGVFGYNGFKT